MQNKDFFSVSLDSGALVLDFNEKASLSSGYSKDVVIGKNWFELFIPDSDLVEVLQVFSNLFHGDTTDWEYVNDITCKDKSTKTMKWTNSIIRDDKRRPIKILSFGVEVVNN